MNIPETLNGYPVLGHAPHKNDSRAVIVIVYRSEQHHQPYVVATWMPHLKSEWHQGDYCKTFREACMSLVNLSADRILPPSKTPNAYRFGDLQDMDKQDYMMFADANPNSRKNDRDPDWMVIVDSSGEVQAHYSGLDVAYGALPGSNEWHEL